MRRDCRLELRSFFADRELFASSLSDKVAAGSVSTAVSPCADVVFAGLPCCTFVPINKSAICTDEHH